MPSAAYSAEHMLMAAMSFEVRCGMFTVYPL
jgi:hypothetical protein